MRKTVPVYQAAVQQDIFAVCMVCGIGNVFDGDTAIEVSLARTHLTGNRRGVFRQCLDG